jgi:hypothetical protein
VLDPYKCTIVEATEFAQNLKRSIGDVGENDCVTLQESEQEFLILFLKLTHPSGERIDCQTAEITIAAKPANCDRPGTSRTCYYIRPKLNAQFQSVWLADCRKMIRSQRLREAAIGSAA